MIRVNRREAKYITQGLRESGVKDINPVEVKHRAQDQLEDADIIHRFDLATILGYYNHYYKKYKRVRYISMDIKKNFFLKI